MVLFSGVTVALVLTAALSVETNAAAQPFPDCGLARYDDSLPGQVVLTLREMAGKLGALPPVEIDVTDIAYAEGVLGAVPDCLDPNVRFLADKDNVGIELRGLAHDVCRGLTHSPDLRAVGATVQVRDVRTDNPMASCGHHPTFALFRVGIGLNVVVVKMPRQLPGAICPATGPAETIRSMIAQNWRDTQDFPRGWDAASRPWRGMPTTAQANRYLGRLEEEFLQILRAAEASGDVARLYSAVFWFIERSDPSEHTARRTDYQGQECDIIRNRILWAFGNRFYECFMDTVSESFASGRLDKIFERALTSCDLYIENPYAIIEDYRQANEQIDKLFRPPTYSAERQRILDRVAEHTASAMTRLDYGACPFYADAVRAWDQKWWEHQTLRQDIPLDWEHDFLESALECLSNR